LQCTLAYRAIAWTLLASARLNFHDCQRAVSRCNILSSIDCIKQQKRTIIGRFAQSNNLAGLTQALTTLTSIALLWWATVVSAGISLWLTAGAVVLLTLFTLRVFALMHECGHGSLFRSPRLNRATGFVLGVISGMPQYVWSQHHAYHHAHNGDWEKYRGPYATRSVAEYAAMSGRQRRAYRVKCSIAAAPVAGFIYLIFMPRYTWITGSLQLVFCDIGTPSDHWNVYEELRDQLTARGMPAGMGAMSFRSKRARLRQSFTNSKASPGRWATFRSQRWLRGSKRS